MIIVYFILRWFVKEPRPRISGLCFYLQFSGVHLFPMCVFAFCLCPVSGAYHKQSRVPTVPRRASGTRPGVEPFISFTARFGVVTGQASSQPSRQLSHKVCLSENWTASTGRIMSVTHFSLRANIYIYIYIYISKLYIYIYIYIVIIWFQSQLIHTYLDGQMIMPVDEQNELSINGENR